MVVDLKVPFTNSVVLAGTLARDPRFKMLDDGSRVTKGVLFQKRRYWTTGARPEQKEETFYIEFEAWRDQADIVRKWRKGRPVILQGSIRMHTWRDSQTNEPRTTIKLYARHVTPLTWDEEPESRGAPAADSR